MLQSLALKMTGNYIEGKHFVDVYVDRFFHDRVHRERLNEADLWFALWYPENFFSIRIE